MHVLCGAVQDRIVPLEIRMPDCATSYSLAAQLKWLKQEVGCIQPCRATACTSIKMMDVVLHQLAVAGELCVRTSASASPCVLDLEGACLLL